MCVSANEDNTVRGKAERKQEGEQKKPTSGEKKKNAESKKMRGGPGSRNYLITITSDYLPRAETRER